MRKMYRSRIITRISSGLLLLGFLASNSVAASDSGDTPRRHEMAQAISDYVGDAKAQMFSLSVAAQMQTGKMEQAIKFHNLDAFKKAAKDFQEITRQIQAEAVHDGNEDDVLNVSEDDANVFENVSNAANDVFGDYVQMASDYGLYADTGILAQGALNKDIRAIGSSERKFKSSTLSAYRYFRVCKSNIDMKNLTLKQRYAGKAK